MTNTDRPVADQPTPAPVETPAAVRYAHSRWLVIRQYNHKPDEVVGGHRFEWMADLSAIRRVWRHQHEVGVHFTSRRNTR